MRPFIASDVDVEPGGRCGPIEDDIRRIGEGASEALGNEHD